MEHDGSDTWRSISFYYTLSGQLILSRRSQKYQTFDTRHLAEGNGGVTVGFSVLLYTFYDTIKGVAWFLCDCRVLVSHNATRQSGD